MSKGPVPENPSSPLPRRGADTPGRIPTKYGPDNPVSEAVVTEHTYRVRPGAPNLPIPEPQRVTAQPATEPPASYAIRPGVPSDTAEDVFTAMADKKSAEDRRRRRLRRGAAVGALLCLGAAGAAAVATSHPARTTQAGPPAHAPVAPGPAAPVLSSAPTPTPSALDPLALLSSAGTDTAPLAATTVFPGSAVTVNSHSYTRALTATSDCASAATAPLAAVLTKSGCHQVFRSTYDNGTTAVTVGVAVFDSAAQANAVKLQATAGNLEPLAGGTLPAFCHAVACRLTANAFGRFAYFTVAGYTTGKPVPATDTAALAAGTDMGNMVFENLVTRARAEVTAKP